MKINSLNKLATLGLTAGLLFAPMSISAEHHHFSFTFYSDSDSYPHVLPYFSSSYDFFFYPYYPSSSSSSSYSSDSFFDFHASW